MGWCSATDLMDRAVSGAEAAVRAVIAEIQRDPGKGRATAEWDVQRVVDDALRPMVASMAGELRSQDWDCEQESAYFDRFPRELLGMDDSEYQVFLHNELRDTDPGEHGFADLVNKLAEVTERMESESHGG